MLRTAGQIHGLVVAAVDGEIGEITALLFDDQHWTVRHLVVDTGKWLPGRKVLISPASVASIEDDPGRIRVTLTTQKIRESPDVDTDKPVSRQKELELARFYGYAPYWGAGDMWGGTYYPPATLSPPASLVSTPPPVPPPDGAVDAAPSQAGSSRGQGDPEGADPHLRSTSEVKGYHVEASDTPIGHVENFVVDDGTWRITHILVDTSNLPGGRTFAVPVTWVKHVEWSTMKVVLSVPSARVQSQPELDTTAAIRPEVEALLRNDIVKDERDGQRPAP